MAIPLDMYVLTTYTCGMATVTSEIKNSRLDVRLTQEQRRQIERAAALKGTSLTQWCVQHLMAAAQEDIQDATVTRLSSQAFDDFLKALDEPMPREAVDLLNMRPQWA